MVVINSCVFCHMVVIVTSSASIRIFPSFRDFSFVHVCCVLCCAGAVLCCVCYAVCIWTYFCFGSSQVHDNIGYGFDPHDDSDHLTIHNNHVYNNGWHGISESSPPPRIHPIQSNSKPQTRDAQM